MLRKTEEENYHVELTSQIGYHMVKYYFETAQQDLQYHKSWRVKNGNLYKVQLKRFKEMLC